MNRELLNVQRAAGYARQRDIQIKGGNTEAEHEELLKGLLSQFTGPQRRRIRHKAEGLRVHEHEQGVRCLRCKPKPSEPGPDAWRSSGKRLEEVL